MATQQRTITFTLDDQAADRYPRIGFEVPEGAPGVDVRTSAMGIDGPAVVDIGCEGAGGWRGWSGGARRDFVITADEATPGYLPGPIEAGEWALVLGLHQLPAAGVQVEVEIDIPPRRAPEPEPLLPPGVREVRGSDRDLPCAPGLRWYATDLHAHTVHSDGQDTIDELARRAVECGLDVLAITDHNTVSHHRLLDAASLRHAVTLLPGQEVTTAQGHANAFGPVRWVDFRRPVETWFDQVAADGGLLSVNHPLADDCAWQHPWVVSPPAVEALHVSWFRVLTDTAGWAYLAVLDALADEHGVPRPVLLGGSDYHRPEHRLSLGTPITWVAAVDDSPAAVLDALHAGRTALAVGLSSAHPYGSDQVIRPDPLGCPVLLRVGDELVADRADGAVLVDADGRRRRVLGQRAVFRASGRSPFRLEDADRRLLAVTR
jgi:hypothetical protein